MLSAYKRMCQKNLMSALLWHLVTNCYQIEPGQLNQALSTTARMLLVSVLSAIVQD